MSELQELNKTQFAKAAGVSVTTLNRFLAGQSVAPESLEKIKITNEKLNMIEIISEPTPDGKPEEVKPTEEVVAAAVEETAPEPVTDDSCEDTPAADPQSKADLKGTLAGVPYEIVNVREAGQKRAGPNHNFTLKFIGETERGRSGRNICLDTHPTNAEVEVLIRKG